MVTIRTTVVAILGIGLVASGVVLTESGDSTPPPNAAVTATPTQHPMEEWVVRVERKAVLMQLCLDGLDDPQAQVRYQWARAAQPSLAYGIDPNCRLIIPGP